MACNKLPVKELYQKIIKFLPDEMNEISWKNHYILWKNAAYDSSDSCDSIIVSPNPHLKKKAHTDYS